MQATQTATVTADPGGRAQGQAASATATRWRIFLALCVLLAAALRFGFPSDIEYKADEQYTFAALKSYRADGAVPLLGMESSAGIRNPGLSVWLFLALGWLSGAQNPVQLARVVAALNIIALLVLIWMARRVVPEPDRDAWSWAAALFAVNPLAVLFARKIWAQSTLPLFSVLLLLAWFYRDRKFGAFFGGVLSAVLGQIHLSGFFIAGGLWLWTALFERRRSRPRHANWRWAAAGAALAALPLVPWIQHVFSIGPRSPEWINLLFLSYWFNWIASALGLGLGYTLGTHLKEFLQGPLFYGHATYMVLVFHVFIFAAATFLIASGSTLLEFTSRDRILGTPSETAFVQSAAWWGTGLLMTGCALPIYMHYLITAYPLPWLWLARGAEGRRGRLALASIWCFQLLLSICFLYYIHVHHGAPGGDYGIAYGYQSAMRQ